MDVVGQKKRQVNHDWLQAKFHLAQGCGRKVLTHEAILVANFGGASISHGAVPLPDNSIGTKVGNN